MVGRASITTFSGPSSVSLGSIGSGQESQLLGHEAFMKPALFLHSPDFAQPTQFVCSSSHASVEGASRSARKVQHRMQEEGAACPGWMMLVKGQVIVMVACRARRMERMRGGMERMRGRMERMRARPIGAARLGAPRQPTQVLPRLEGRQRTAYIKTKPSTDTDTI